MSKSGKVFQGAYPWPTGLDDLNDTPASLNYLGDALLLTEPRHIAIVGARSATTYGEHVASQIAYTMAERGWVIVSGGAYGIDAAAHRGALATKGRTIAVMAGGLDRLYPPGNTQLLERIGREGLLVSEQPDGHTASRQDFLLRNRIIAALSQVLVVVEATMRSGSMNTVGHARSLLRPVYTVPGPGTSGLSEGTNLLLHSGARAVLSAEWLARELGDAS